MCGQSLKTIFQFFEKSPWKQYISKNLFKFWNKFLHFKVATTKFSWKLTMFQKSFYMFKMIKKNMWTSGSFVSKSLFLIKCSPNHLVFFMNFNIFHKKGSMCSKHSKNKTTHTFLDFDIQTSLSIIIILDL